MAGTPPVGTASSKEDVKWAIESTRDLPIPEVLGGPQFDRQREILKHASIRVLREMKDGGYGEHGVALADGLFSDTEIGRLLDGTFKYGALQGLPSLAKSLPDFKRRTALYGLDRLADNNANLVKLRHLLQADVPPIVRPPSLPPMGPTIEQKQLEVLNGINDVLGSLLEVQRDQIDQAERDRQTARKRFGVTFVFLIISVAVAIGGLVLAIAGNG